ncbi:MAG TPA: Dickkopf N-terminal cysteine-rich domain-containing protein, partial [Labilithrix sp.]
QVQVDGKAGDTPCIGTRDGDTTSSSFGSGTMMMPPPSKGFICDVANGIACSSTTQQCTAIPMTGQPCDPNDFEYACAKTAYCDFNGKTCKDRQPAGADCSTNSQACADMTYCDETSRKCTAVVAQGQPCKTSTECGQSASCTNGTCQGSSGNFGLALICK